MSRFFKYVDRCPDIPGSLPDHIMEGDSEAELEFEALLISDNSTEIINAPVEIITVSSSEDELEDVDECTPGLAASEVSESSGDEGEEDLDGVAEDLDEAVGGRDTVEPEKSKLPLEDDKPIPQNIPGLEEAVEGLDEGELEEDQGSD